MSRWATGTGGARWGPSVEAESRRSDVRYEVVPEQDAVLVDRTLESMGVDVEGLKSNFGRKLEFALLLFLLVLVIGAAYIAAQLN